MSDRSSETLAAQIIVYRLLGIDKEAAVNAMQELSERKSAGDPFDYEKFINEKLALAPKSQMSNGNINKTLQDILANMKNIGLKNAK